MALGQIVGTVLAVTAGATAASCPDFESRITGGGFEVEHSLPTSPPVASDFGFYYRVCLPNCKNGRANAVQADISAYMVAHRHGMNYEVAQARLDGCWHVDGMLFHMTGDWEVRFDVRMGARVSRATVQMVVD